MQREERIRRQRPMLVRAVCAVGLGLAIVAGTIMQSATLARGADAGSAAVVPPLQRATNTAGPTSTPTPTPSMTPTPAGPGPTPTPTTGGTVDPTLPDLVVLAMRISTETYSPCATSFELGLEVTVRNNGGSAAGPFSIIANDNAPIAVAGLGAGETLRVWFLGYRSGTDNVATVDSTNAVAESNESNNTLSQRLPVPTPPVRCTATPTASVTPTPGGPTVTPTMGGTVNPMLPDLVVVAMRISTETYSPCATSYALGLEVTVRNNGGSAAGPFSVVANDNAPIAVAGLGAGETLRVWFLGYRSGTDNVATVDSTNAVAESNEGNNTLAQMLPVPTPPVLCTATPTVDLTTSPTTTAIPTVGMTMTPTGTVQPDGRTFLPMVAQTREESPTPER